MATESSEPPTKSPAPAKAERTPKPAKAPAPSAASQPAASEKKPAASPKKEAPKAPKKEIAASAKATPAPSGKGKAEPKAKAAASPPVKIVEKPTPPVHQARAKATLTPELRARLRLRDAIASRRPNPFRRQQWYEYKRLKDSGWRRPTGVDSAMRRHFGYEQPVVRVGFRGPRETRGLHPSGFEEVYVDSAAALARVTDPARQAARVAATLGARTLKTLYAEADKRGVRILNRRKLP